MDTFKKINSNKVVSSEGFVFEIINTEYCLYEEATAAIEVKWFYDPKKEYFYFDKSSMLTWKIPANKKMAAHDIIRVNNNLERALKFLLQELHTNSS